MIYITIYGERYPLVPGDEIDLLVDEEDIGKIEKNELVIKDRDGNIFPLGALLFEDGEFTIEEPSIQEKKIYPPMQLATVTDDLEKALFYNSILGQYNFEMLKAPSIESLERLKREEAFEHALIHFDFFDKHGFRIDTDIPFTIIVENINQKNICESGGFRFVLFNEDRPWEFRDEVYEWAKKPPTIPLLRSRLSLAREEACPSFKISIKYKDKDKELVRV